MIKCLDCDYMEIESGYCGDSHNCIHSSCFKDKKYEYSCYCRALYGDDFKIIKERITNFEEKNCTHDCKDFKKKRSILKRIFFCD